ncbi:bifunctional glutamate N-acetyltransferase/amino-acid acetyltransferase ArgJ [bacterium]|mgnify:CR=1 FL=1|jgi:glutamate N-acetyltransferase / amino-acid N-acetyltransferase|nr:bifunctional glutamate N-acetyltransferase/amino-acid acetyltransferase ArgJ [bacterium]
MFTVLKGVFTNGIHCGIKKKKRDLSFIYVPNVFATAGVFTKNKMVAASVVHTKKCLKSNNLKAVIINSGNANAATGKQGELDVKETSKLAADYFGINRSEVGIASTGIIGKTLDMDSLRSGLENLLTIFKKKPEVIVPDKKLSEEIFDTLKNGKATADAILTTDLVEKTSTRTVKIGKKNITVTGMTKGSGMIAPNMATTLLFLVTNATIPKNELQEYLNKAINRSFNMLSVDTDTSTNDMGLLFSTGEYKFDSASKDGRDLFQELLSNVCIDLAKKIAMDGEGATKMIEVRVNEAQSVLDAKKVALNVVNSPLVKTAIFGEDPNWGRIVASACKDPSVKINPSKMDVSIDGVLVYSKGNPVDLDESEIASIFKAKEVTIELVLGIGTSSSVSWGCDLTHGYIDINTEYS